MIGIFHLGNFVFASHVPWKRPQSHQPQTVSYRSAFLVLLRLFLPQQRETMPIGPSQLSAKELSRVVFTWRRFFLFPCSTASLPAASLLAHSAGPSGIKTRAKSVSVGERGTKGETRGFIYTPNKWQAHSGSAAQFGRPSSRKTRADFLLRLPSCGGR